MNDAIRIRSPSGGGCYKSRPSAGSRHKASRWRSKRDRLDQAAHCGRETDYEQASRGRKHGAPHCDAIPAGPPKISPTREEGLQTSTEKYGPRDRRMLRRPESRITRHEDFGVVSPIKPHQAAQPLSGALDHPPSTIRYTDRGDGSDHKSDH